MTYSDVGGCKEQIDKLREVVETPLLHVSNILLSFKSDFKLKFNQIKILIKLN